MAWRLIHATGVLAGTTLLATTGLTQNTGGALDKARIEEGIAVYKEHCVTCHGENLVSPGPHADLRQLQPADRDRFNRIVWNGRGQMPPWKGIVKDEELDAVWAYVMSARQ